MRAKTIELAEAQGMEAVAEYAIMADPDLCTQAEESLMMHKAIPGAQFPTIPNTWHLPNLGQPEAFHCHIRNFLQCAETHIV